MDKKDQVIDWITKTLVSKGFSVEKNAVISGDGVKHTLDLLAETTVLPGSRIRIGIVVSENNINTDYVEKLLGWLSELHGLKMIVVALGGVDSDARLLASRYGLDIVSLPPDAFEEQQLSTSSSTGFNTVFAKPLLSIGKASEIISDEVKPSLFKPSKCYLEKLVLVYYPLIEYVAELPRIDTESAEAEIVEARLLFDGLNGYLVKINGGFLKILREYGSFTDLSDEALEVLKILNKERQVELGVLSARTKMDQHMLRSILVELSLHGFIDVYGDLAELKSIDTRLFNNIDDYFREYGVETSIYKLVNDSLVLDVNVPMHRIADLINGLGAKLINTRIIYYPLYVALLYESGENVKKEKIIVVDGVSGEKLEDFSIQIAGSDVLDRIKGYSTKSGEQ